MCFKLKYASDFQLFKRKDIRLLARAVQTAFQVEHKQPLTRMSIRDTLNIYLHKSAIQKTISFAFFCLPLPSIEFIARLFVQLNWKFHILNRIYSRVY